MDPLTTDPNEEAGPGHPSRASDAPEPASPADEPASAVAAPAAPAPERSRGSRGRADRLGVIIAFLVATVSIISAIVASRAAIWASNASTADSVVLQQAIERQQLETQVRTTAASDLRYVARFDAAHKEAFQLLVDAEFKRTDDPAGAGRADIAAQTALQVDVALGKYFHAALPEYDKNGDLVFDAEGAVDAIAAADPRLAELRRSTATERALAMHERSLQLVGITVLFVAALFALTLAEVWPGRSRGRWAPLLVAVGLATAAGVLTVLVEPDTAGLLAGIAIVAAVVLLVVLLVERRRDREAEAAAAAAGVDASAAAAGEDGPAEPEGGSKRFRSTVALMLAVATLLAAGVGYLQGQAADEASLATREAEDEALLALAEHQQDVSWAEAQVDVWSVVDEQTARAQGARQLADWLRSTGDEDGAIAALADAKRADDRAKTAAALTQLSLDHPDGPRNDPEFPTRFLRSQQEASVARTALQDLANEVSSAWGNRFSGYIAMLAILAIAAYLLGVSLVLRTRQLRWLFALTGTGLVIAAAVGAAATIASPADAVAAGERETIADAFAAANVADSTALTSADRRAAVDAWQEVVRLHPTLARAHARFSDAIFAAGALWAGRYEVVAPPEVVTTALAELERAVALGWDDVNTRSSLGFYRFLLGLDDPTSGLGAQAVADAEAALEAAPELPLLRFDLAAALLAEGRVAEAAPAYESAIAALDAKGPDGKLTYAAGERAAVASAALGDLGLIEAARADRPEIVDATATARRSIVVATGDPIPADRPADAVTVSNLAIDESTAELWWTADLPGFDPDRDALSVIWERHDPATGAWIPLADMTGPLRLSEGTLAGGLQRIDDADGYSGIQNRLRSGPSAECLTSGRYRVQLFLNGRAAASQEQQIDLPERTADTWEDLGVRLCRPTDWTIAEVVPGSKVRYVDPTGTKSMTIQDVYRPYATDGSEVAAVLDELALQWSQGARENADPPQDTYLMGLDHAQVQWYDGAAGTFKVLAGADSFGTVYAVSFAGPADWVDSDETYDIQRAIAS
ncbi:MAG: hypothetical protein U0869_09555 [Chloroflexota bacterium]